jgi:hypothetical protein
MSHPEGQRQPYQTPTLVEYGSVQDLTAGGSGAQSELKGGMCQFPMKLNLQHC